MSFYKDCKDTQILQYTLPPLPMLSLQVIGDSQENQPDTWQEPAEVKEEEASEERESSSENSARLLDIAESWEISEVLVGKVT